MYVIISTETEILRYFPSPQTTLPEGAKEKELTTLNTIPKMKNGNTVPGGVDALATMPLSQATLESKSSALDEIGQGKTVLPNLKIWTPTPSP